VLNRLSKLLVTLSLAGCAATGAPDGAGVDAELEATLDGALPESDDSGVTYLALSAADVSTRPYRGGTLVTLRGDAGAGLWDVLEDAGLSITRRGRLEYIYGRSLACVTNRSAAVCQVATDDASDVDGFLFAIHGARFRSAASELFGAIAAANGEDARTATSVERDGFLCEKTAREVWCGLRAPSEGPDELELSLSGLGDLGDDYVYEGWLITPDGPVTSGRFRMGAASGSGVFTVDPALAADASMFVLTIEPAVGDDPAPADTHVVAGAFDADGVAQLTTLHPAAIGTDFGDASGVYILQTPSTASIPEDYDQGIWFVEPGMGAGLDLPALPAGWAYEGWVVGADGPVTTGTFLATDAADDDAGGPTAGPDGTPPFPGQDFIDPPMLVSGTTIVISVEPVPDNAPAPFFIKPLVDMTAEDVGPAVMQAMDNVAADDPAAGVAALR